MHIKRTMAAVLIAAMTITNTGCQSVPRHDVVRNIEMTCESVKAEKSRLLSKRADAQGVNANQDTIVYGSLLFIPSIYVGFVAAFMSGVGPAPLIVAPVVTYFLSGLAASSGKESEIARIDRRLDKLSNYEAELCN